jgi:protein-L-isoaspartate(D-aspartate) O-methyltransferase
MNEARARMVEQQIRARGITDPSVLEAMRDVPREAFVPPAQAPYAFEDGPLPIGEGQTISQPFIVALMAEALRLRPTDRALEVGAGSGYAAAVLARLASEVWAIERHAPLARAAEERLAALAIGNVRIVQGDGTLGLPAEAPFDAILVSAGGPRVPEALKAQLAPGGRLVIPVGPEGGPQDLRRVTRVGEGWTEESLGGVRFVPLIGAQGFGGDSP